VTAREVVDDAHALTPTWLSRALGAEVRSVECEQIGTGQMGATFRLVLDADGLPPTLVVKLAAGDADARRRVRSGYRAEVGFYAELATTVDVRTPGCWYAAIADDGATFTLVLDDLAPRVPGVQADGCSVDQAADAVRNLAGLHAPRWSDASIFDHRFLRRPTEEGARYLASAVVAAAEGFVARYASELDADDAATLTAAADAMAEWQLSGWEHFAPIHGDYRLDNLMFPPEGPGVAVVDWQSLTAGPPARDLAFFLGTSLDTDTRRDAEHDLVAAYHAELVARGVDGYDLGRCFDDYRLGQLQAVLVTTTGAMYATADRSESADRMFLAMARRSCAAIRDLASLDAISSSGTTAVQETGDE
jgi:hypothetical protein